jgi:hypothetical protein
MDAAWVVAAISAAGVFGQLAIGMRNSGKRDQLIDAHQERINKHSAKIDWLERSHAAHGERLAKVEARCSVRGHAGE